jgi:hypothetical protein
MARRFGSAPIGCAGENLIVATTDRMMPADLTGVLLVRGSGTEFELHRPRVAAPCAEFTSWIKRLDRVVPKAEQPEDLAFLDDGMRGYILDVSHLERPMPVRVGDEVLVRS